MNNLQLLAFAYFGVVGVRALIAVLSGFSGWQGKVVYLHLHSKSLTLRINALDRTLEAF